MVFNKNQRKKASDIFEKLGLTMLVVAAGDLIVGQPSTLRLLLDIVGVLLGINLLVVSIEILKGDE